MITFSEFCAVPLDSFLFLRYVVLLTKEAAHMRDTLENLYFGNITPNEQIVKSGTALKKAMEQSAECEEKHLILKLFEKMNIQGQLLINRVDQAIGKRPKVQGATILPFCKKAS